MARCGCEGLTCACKVQAADATITVTGDGPGTDPYKISSNQGFIGNGITTPTVQMHVAGSGTRDDKYVLSADAVVSLDELTNVSTTGAKVGDVLAYMGSGSWSHQAPVTAPTGAVQHGTCLAGDGSSANPLTVNVEPGGGLVCDTDGLRATLAVQGEDQRTWNHQWRAADAAMHYGQSSIAAEYMRWGMFCWLRFSFVGGSGFNGGTDIYHWTAPFPAAGPDLQVLPGRLRTSNGSRWMVEAIVNNDTTDVQLLVPNNQTNNYLQNMRNSDGTGKGTGWPQIPGVYPLDGTPDSRLNFQGWYRIKDGA